MAKPSTADTLPNRFDHAAAQQRIYRQWEAHNYFHAEPDASKTPYCIVIPPPNVTGALHLGHALNNTLQDILIRMKRMQGAAALWMPGTDHAGIATQAVVEKRLLEQEGKTRHDLGRAALVERIWAWKDEYETRIVNQLKSMGCSCDWERQRFTLDDVCARAVRRTFFDLFAKQLIYRGKRLVNWDTFLQTAVSDDEVFHEAVQGHFWHFRYPVIDPQLGEPTHVTIATTRPETMLGDTAVAVHPDPTAALDEAIRDLEARLAAAPGREQEALAQQLETVRTRRDSVLPQLLQLRDMALAGRTLRLPLVDREIPLVADPWAKPEMGSGCVKITPAHDPNDYDVALRCDLPMVNILNPEGTLNANAGPYAGQTVLEARAQVVADLDKLGLLGEVEDREIDLAHSDRSKTPIEPYLADQWFVRMEDLAQSAMDAVADGRVRIIPERYARGYHDWLAEKRDWPVSRQLWWGHRIPIWSREFADEASAIQYGTKLAAAADVVAGRVAWTRGSHDDGLDPDSAARAAATIHICLRDDADQLAEKFEADGFAQVEDVLDTWFSSALWPHSTLGWPEQTPELNYFYPTNVLITSRDIITLWVARMVLTGLNNIGEIPFHEVYIHTKILDGTGETMSKSKGNGVDPVDVIDKFGADALRFGLASMATGTQDVRLPVQFECPHCGALIDQTRENRVWGCVPCGQCGQAFRTQWARSAEDLALPRGAVVSERFEVARNFCNKLWNASRFVLMNLDEYSAEPVADADLGFEDRWILSRLARVSQEVTTQLASYRYADAAHTLHDFAWDEFCSAYVEMVKHRLQDTHQRGVAQRVAVYVLDNLLRLLHPFVPFITEEVWQLMQQKAPARGLSKPCPMADHIIVATWPTGDEAHLDARIEQQFNQFHQVLSALREIRSRQNIAPRKPIEFAVRCPAEMASQLTEMGPYFRSLAAASSTSIGPAATAPPTSATVQIDDVHVYVNLAGLIDIEAERNRLGKEEARLTQAISGKERKLANDKFVSRAPADVVQRERDSLTALRAQLQVVAQSLASLGSLPTDD